MASQGFGSERRVTSARTPRRGGTSIPSKGCAESRFGAGFLMIRSRAFHLCALLCTLAPTLPAAQFSKATIAGKGATVCTVDARSERIQLFLHDDSGQPFKSFETVERHLAQRVEKLVFAI